MPIYSCVGSPAAHERFLLRLARRRGVSFWTIHSGARAGDTALFYLTEPISAFVLRGVLLTDAKRNEDARSQWYGFYMARIRTVDLLPDRVHVRELKQRFPGWGWLKSPIKSSRIPDEAAAALLGSTPTINAKSVHEASLPDVDAESPSAVGGAAKWSLHLRRERSTALRSQKREAGLAATGRLACEACGLDFEQVYGALGKGFCEVHHLTPLAELKEASATDLTDLAVVCSNCHRMLHRRQPMPSITTLSKLVARSRPTRR